MSDRKKISKKTRFEVFKRDGFKCVYCGKSAPEVVLVIDHIDPVSKGGKHDILNFATSCEACNSGKSDRKLDDQSTLAKQMVQLQELNEKREQLEMLIEWKKGMDSITDESIEKIASYWWDITGGVAYLNETGLAQLRQLVVKYGAAMVIEKMKEASSYLKVEGGKYTFESASLAWQKVAKMCSAQKLYEKKPYMRDVFYIRGIIRNRYNWMPPSYEVADYIEQAILDGVEVEAIKRAAKLETYWSAFTDHVDALRGME